MCWEFDLMKTNYSSLTSDLKIKSLFALFMTNLRTSLKTWELFTGLSDSIRAMEKYWENSEVA